MKIPQILIVGNKAESLEIVNYIQKHKSLLCNVDFIAKTPTYLLRLLEKYKGIAFLNQKIILYNNNGIPTDIGFNSIEDLISLINKII